MQGGTLTQYVQNLNEAQLRRITKQILRALQCLHGQNIVHMDLKPENVLVKGKFSANELKFDVKLCDFGLASFVDPYSQGVQTFAGTV